MELMQVVLPQVSCDMELVIYIFVQQAIFFDD
jgi:hypothetical protein